jgi:DNA helicase HerA-like ATPase
VLGSLDKLGIVVGEASTTEFLFLADEEKHPPRWEYVLVKSKENIGNEEVEVNVIAQIDAIYSTSNALSEEIRLETAEKIKDARMLDRRLIAKARVLGYLHNGEVLQPRRAVYPGNYVFKAPKDTLEEFYSYPQEEGLLIGHLITREDVNVSISIKGLRRHLAILAQTGAGKSYTAGCILEELLRKGATVVLIDPHADYTLLSRRKDGTKFSDRISIFKTPQSTGRYDEGKIGKKINYYEVKFSDLSVDEICKICGISEKWTNIISIIQASINDLSEDYTLEDLINKLEEKAKKPDPTALKALNYIKRIGSLKVFGSVTTDINKLLKPKHISVIDLSGLDDRVSNYITFKILSSIYEEVESQSFKYPVFIFIEEAHRFVPNNGNTLSKNIIKKIAAEGRKFGIFLVLITQRPYKIDQDALSQCNSQIIMRITNPEDQKAIKTSSERISEDLLNDLPGLNVGEAVIIGEVTKTPVMVKIRQRETEEGGSDVDIVNKLKEALEAVHEEEVNKGDKLREELSKYKDMME